MLTISRHYLHHFPVCLTEKKTECRMLGEGHTVVLTTFSSKSHVVSDTVSPAVSSNIQDGDHVFAQLSVCCEYTSSFITLKIVLSVISLHQLDYFPYLFLYRQRRYLCEFKLDRISSPRLATFFFAKFLRGNNMVVKHSHTIYSVQTLSASRPLSKNIKIKII